MNILIRNKRKIYLCSRYVENGIEKFKEPEPIELNYQPTNSSEQLYAFGTNYSIYLMAKTDLEIGAKFRAGDRCYIYETPPETHDVLCKKADYIVSGQPISTLNNTEIMFKRLSSNEDNQI